ncbi:MAG TPA: response regulator [Polyangiaceae bacterium]|nr:response regulator [Polyangiaceae bacterium]
MQITFRIKLLSIVAISMLALLAVVGGSALIGVRQTRDLADVEGRMVPRAKLGPELEGEFDRLSRTMQDAVAAQDAPLLGTTHGIKNRLFDVVSSSGNALDPREAAAIRWAVQDYYESARNVAGRLIAGETGESLVADMAVMQEGQRKAAAVIKKATGFDEGEFAKGFAAVRDANRSADEFRFAIGLCGLALVMTLSLWVSRGMLQGLSYLTTGFARFATGQFDSPIPVVAEDELGQAAREANLMAEKLKRLAELRERHDWIKAGQAGLSDELRGELEPAAVAKNALAFLARWVKARAGAVYLTEDGALRLASHYAMSRADADATDDAPVSVFRLGEGLVGQAAERDELFVVDDPPEGYLEVRSGLGRASPRAIVFVPLVRLGRPIAVMELALFAPCSDETRELLQSVCETLVIALEAAKSAAASRDLLARTKQQAERLTAQEEELRLNNQELLAQQEELRHANKELEAQGNSLAQKNAELEDARRRVQQKADELGKVSSYKSQFLANMSHELRTPLNSMLLLSHLLAENEDGNLTPKQIEHSRTIHSAGQDLLVLINQVLDLSKIEAGKQELDVEAVELQRFADHARRVFGPLAAEKELRLVVEIAPGLPKAIHTDKLRLERILTNLLGNAIKFTERGEVALRIGRPPERVKFERADLSPADAVAFAVSDTGIGIPLEAQERVFAPFEQVEGTSDRRYAGTGLGLAIARESAGLLGGELQLESEPGKGSTFTCYLPKRAIGSESERPNASLSPSAGEPKEVHDDRLSMQRGEAHLLVVEDDVVLADQLMDIIRARRLKVLVARTGQEGLLLAQRHKPRGIILDVKLPDIDGFTVMDLLQSDPDTRSIPVHFVSGVDDVERGMALGAIGYLTKPATHAELAAAVRALSPASVGARRVLVVEDNVSQGESVVALLKKDGILADHVTCASAALGALKEHGHRCIVLDLGLPDMDGLQLLETIRAMDDAPMPRVVVHTGRALTKIETRQLELYAESVVMKDGKSADRLLEEIRLFVSHVTENMPARAAAREPEPATGEISLRGRTILLAEDDMRTVYAVSALLRGKGAEVLVAETGREALDLLSKRPLVHAVLMDVMMPEMDGYEAMRRLRREPRFASLPVIALTAKAMKGERERCIEAGASDYLTKPVESHRLLATLKKWLEPELADG